VGEFVSNCPRCGAKNITHNLHAAIWVNVSYDWQNRLELFVECRHCHKPSIQLAAQKCSGDEFSKFCRRNNELLDYKGSANDIVKFERFITLRDNHHFQSPPLVPDRIAAIVDEANSCLAADCFNAAGAMYRLSLDLATKQLLPDEGEPITKIRRSLGLRVEWLFDKGILREDLRPLASCLQKDGNDGAHDGTLKREDAEDLQDFAFELLRRLFTEPERLKLAEERRNKRREES
jgi:hypothetical protein